MRWARWFAVLGSLSDSCDRQTQGDVTENVIENPRMGIFIMRSVEFLVLCGLVDWVG